MCEKTQAPLLQVHPWDHTCRLTYIGRNKLFCILFSACVLRTVHSEGVFIQRKDLQEPRTYFHIQTITTVNLFSRRKPFQRCHSTAQACKQHATRTFNQGSKGESFSETHAIRLMLQVCHLGFPNSTSLQGVSSQNKKCFAQRKTSIAHSS